MYRPTFQEIEAILDQHSPRTPIIRDILALIDNGPAKREPKFKPGQWIKDEDDNVYVVSSVERHGGSARYVLDLLSGESRAGFVFTSVADEKWPLVKPDARLRWPNGPPWPGTTVCVVEHPVDALGEGQDKNGNRRGDFVGFGFGLNPACVTGTISSGNDTHMAVYMHNLILDK